MPRVQFADPIPGDYHCLLTYIKAFRKWRFDSFGSTLRVLPAWLPRQKSLRFLPELARVATHPLCQFETLVALFACTALRPSEDLDHATISNSRSANSRGIAMNASWDVAQLAIAPDSALARRHEQHGKGAGGPIYAHVHALAFAETEARRLAAEHKAAMKQALDKSGHHDKQGLNR
jgi:hypothetical protein